LHSVDDVDDFPIFDDGAWPDLRPLPDPILVRVLTEDMDMAVGLVDARSGDFVGESNQKEDKSVYYSFSFPEDYVGGHHRMYGTSARPRRNHYPKSNAARRRRSRAGARDA
jgi:hypothetical protein